MKQISSLQHPLVKHLVKLRQNSDYRYDHHSILIEGSKIIAEAAPITTFKHLLTVSPDLIPKSIKADEILLTTPDIIQKISGLKSSEGILAEIPMPQNQELKDKNYILALDNINDPGNLGTIIRTALALGWEGIFLIDETCDPFNDKSLRASRGAVLKLPIMKGSWDDLKKIIVNNQLQCYVADIEGTPFEQVPPAKGLLLVLGNEAHGPSTLSLNYCKPVNIPMKESMESLNVSVAAGILMYSLRHKR